MTTYKSKRELACALGVDASDLISGWAYRRLYGDYAEYEGILKLCRGGYVNMYGGCKQYVKQDIDAHRADFLFWDFCRLSEVSVVRGSDVDVGELRLGDKCARFVRVRNSPMKAHVSAVRSLFPKDSWRLVSVEIGGNAYASESRLCRLFASKVLRVGYDDIVLVPAHTPGFFNWYTHTMSIDIERVCCICSSSNRTYVLTTRSKSPLAVSEKFGGALDVVRQLQAYSRLRYIRIRGLCKKDSSDVAI
jgi:hypothetical protein